MLGKAVAICEFRIFFLQVTGIRQQDFTEIRSRAGAEGRPGKTLLDQQRKVAGVIEMGVREQNRIDPMGIDREAIPIAQPQRLEALKQAAIDQQSMVGTLNEVLGAGNGSSAAQEGKS